MLKLLRAPGLWMTAGFLVAAVGLERWIDAAGGPDAILERDGLATPALVVLGVLVQAALAAAPFPSELWALASSAVHGWLVGGVMTWAGWTLGSMIQYGLARRSAEDVDLEARLARVPERLRRLPVTHPLFLIAVRWFPLGFHVANLTAGARRVPAARQLWIAAVGSIPGAILWAGIGAGAMEGLRWI